MRFATFLLAGLVSFLGVMSAPAPSHSAESTDSKKINSLVEQLGAAEFADREKATQELDAIGAPALECLRKAVKEGDAEVQRRGDELIKRIERKVETEKALRPLMVRLTFKNTPLKEALDEFTKKSGMTFNVIDPRKDLADRKVTLDTGNTTFWQAFDQFCEKAGVSEATAQDLSLANGGSNTPESQGPVLKSYSPRMARNNLLPPGTIGLVNGNPHLESVYYAGSLRIRALPAGTAIANPYLPPKTSNEIEFPIQISPQPNMGWHGLSQIRIDKALDEHGQELVEEKLDKDKLAEVAFLGNGARVMRGGFASRVDAFYPTSGATQVGVRFQKPLKNPRTLKEIRGTVTAFVQSETKTLLKTDPLGQIKADDAFDFEEGGTIKFLKLTKQNEGLVEMDLQVTIPGTVIPSGPAARPTRVINGKVLAVQPEPTRSPMGTGTPSMANGYGGVFLLDEKGQAVALQSGNSTFERQPDRTVRMIYHLSFKARKDQVDKAYLTFNGSRQISIEVPFQLKEAPLQ